MDNQQPTTPDAREEQMVKQAFQRLIDTYLSTPHRKKVELITRAFNFANHAHKGVRRLSGEPYIMHPLAVAQIVCEEIGLGSTSICAALLHDVVEDTDYSVEDIQNIFGEKIAQIVDGLTKISGGIFGEKASAQAESFKKLLLTMSEDIRVILVKISDRLHNMRTLGSQLPGKQYKIAGETLYIYAPLAHRLGLNKVKEELEDLSFRYEHPEEYDDIRSKLSGMQAKLDNTFTDFIRPIREELDKRGIVYSVKARVKTPFSIWQKMQHKGIPFEEVYDILAARIVFTPRDPENEIAECFQIYAIASNIYKPHPERFRDWLSHPKANGYQALHTTLMSKTGKWIEVQIRSERMDEIAEQGFAAHWKYKEGEKSSETSETELNKWLQTIKEILDNPQPSALDFLDAIKLNLYANEIFVVTPKGEFKTMPAGCTALDFAFSIHTFLGTHCIGAKVNHNLVPLNYVLRSGDQVEVLTSNRQTVDESWLHFITTAKARSKVVNILRRKEREKQKAGEQTLRDFFQRNDVEVNSLNIDKLCLLHQTDSREQLYAAIGTQTVVLGKEDLAMLRNKSRHRKSWKKYLNPFKRSSDKREDNAPQDGSASTATYEKVDRKKPLILNEETISHYVIAPCCQPIPGDDVLAYMDPLTKRIVIHKRQCPEADKLKAKDGNRILHAEWQTHKKLFFPASIRVDGIDHQGVLFQITSILSQQLNLNIRKLSVQASDGLFQCLIQMEVHDIHDVQLVTNDLKKISEVKTVTRIS
ncbi:MAG: RelA/SpoT family protein [Prevotellaceae bacterium]|nr:RelA/SpoT family protein [Prevotellaceae bacterium]